MKGTFLSCEFPPAAWLRQVFVRIKFSKAAAPLPVSPGAPAKPKELAKKVPPPPNASPEKAMSTRAIPYPPELLDAWQQEPEEFDKRLTREVEPDLRRSPERRTRRARPFQV
jgi:hypothetical protein